MLPATSKHWVGDGFNVHPVFAHLAFTKEVSPFLMFDYASPRDFPSTNKQRGVGTHPHRGFETVTVAFQGEVEHGDNKGNGGVIGAGDVQWMTAGRGIVHEEYHSRAFAASGGTFEMCQLWVNLPKKHKMTKPRYQAILSKQIPVQRIATERHGGSGAGEGKAATGTGASVRVIAGSYAGAKGPAKTFSEVGLWDVQCKDAEQVLSLDVPERHNTMLFVRRGRVTVLGAKKAQTLNPQQVALLSFQGDHVRIRTDSKDVSILVLSGEVIDEPIAARGPFVMNTQKELQQAMIDYQMGKF